MTQKRGFRLFPSSYFTVCETELYMDMPALVKSLEGAANRLDILRLPACHVLCCTFSHEGCSLLSVLLSMITQL